MCTCALHIPCAGWPDAAVPSSQPAGRRHESGRAVASLARPGMGLEPRGAARPRRRPPGIERARMDQRHVSFTTPTATYSGFARTYAGQGPMGLPTDLASVALTRPCARHPPGVAAPLHIVAVKSACRLD